MLGKENLANHEQIPQALQSSEPRPFLRSADGKSRVSALYELCQAHRMPQPEVVPVHPENRSHPMMHYCLFKVGEQQFGVGEGRTKKAAKEMAADLAMQELLKQTTGSGYSPIGSELGDQFAALSWNCLNSLSQHAPEAWRFAGYKVLAAFIMQNGDDDPGTVVSLGTGNK